ncbi:MAG: bifunctional methylenetetrahydrofolate dehydrogenase/methenyltetrahydrofolate cyclohydrolase FolD [Synergistaceae bacterium]|nr:bifunctional methylenetetrahydrofolate dehydrogenase/methenyltetrahydrofolate cyclohydrolase FolD [Synergistaceae bacterium]
MSALIIDGKKIAAGVTERLKNLVSNLPAGEIPGLAVVHVGDDPASAVYVRQKERASREIGIRSYVHKLPESATQDELLRLIDKLNKSAEIDGILVQLPLPGSIDAEKVIAAVLPEKDADGFHPANVGKLWMGDETVEPCTPKGIMALLDSTGVDMSGMEAVVIGRSNIVGKPISAMLLSRHCSVTICHSRTKNLPEVSRRADILVAAIGKPNFVTGGMIKSRAIVIDVGINRVNGKLAGDVEFETASRKASWITPVPGGVGPMTIAMLMSNTIQLAGLIHSERGE